MAATKSAGRVSIRVLPDSTRFKRDLETSLRRIERSMQVKIPVELELARAELAKLKRQIESLVIKIRPTIELNVSAADIAQLKASIEAMRPVVQVQLDTARAATRMANLSRSRRIDMSPVLDNLAVANFLAKMKGLAGLNVIGDSFRGATEFFQNIDRNAVKFSGLISKVGALVALIGAATQALVVMGAQLAAMAKIGFLAPAFLTGMGISIAIAAAAFKDMGTVLADLKPKFAAFQDSISKDFWREAAEPIRKMVNYLIPLLNTTEGTTNTARSLGQFFAEMANSITDLLTADKLNFMLDRMNRSIDILKTAIRPLTNAFINLGIHGSKYFERFSTWIVKLSNDFDAFITRSAANGDLDRWTENAIQGFKDLGNMIRGTFRFFDSINTAAIKAGAATMGDFADALNRAADTMNQPRFQKTMVTLFEGMNAAVAGIGRGLRNLGPAIESAAPSIKRMFETLGVIFEKVGGIIAKIIENPALQAGMESFLKNIVIALDKLAPAAKPFADSLGGLLDLMGKVLVAVSELGAKIMIEWGPIFDKMGAKLAEMIDPLSKSLQNFVEKMTPVWESFRVNVLDKVVDMINNHVLPAVDKIVNAAAPELERAFKEVGRFLDEIINPALKLLTEELDKAITKKGEFHSIFDLPKLADPKTFGFKGGWLTDPGNWEHDRDKINRKLAGLNDSVNQALEDFWADAGRNLQKGWEGFWEDVWKGAEGAKEDRKKWFSDTFLKPIQEGWDGMWEDLEKWYEEQKSRFQKFMNKLLGFGDKDNSGSAKPGAIVGGGGGKGRGVGGKITPEMLGLGTPESNWLDELNAKVNESITKFFTDIGQNLTNFGEDVKINWDLFWGGLGTKVEEIWNGMLTWIELKKTEIKTSIDTWIAEVKLNWDTFWGGLGTKVEETWQGFLTWIELKKTEIKTSIDTWIAEVKLNWDNFWNGLNTKVGEAWQGFLDWVELKKAEIKLAIDTWIAEVKLNWDTFWNGLGTKVQTAWQGFLDWINMKVQEIKNNINTFIEQVKTNWNNFWNTVGTILRLAWEMIIAWIRLKINEAVEWVKSLPGRAKAALDAEVNKLKESGKNLIQGFINGMGEMLEGAKRKAAEIVQAVKDFFPASPAKVGPFSGTGYTPYSGRALVKDFADGMMSNMDKVRKATKAVAQAAHLGSQVDLETNLDQDGVVIDRRQVNIHNYNPVAEPASRTIEKTANQLRMAKAL